jgi:hypothetical protein
VGPSWAHCQRVLHSVYCRIQVWAWETGQSRAVVAALSRAIVAAAPWTSFQHSLHWLYVKTRDPRKSRAVGTRPGPSHGLFFSDFCCPHRSSRPNDGSSRAPATTSGTPGEKSQRLVQYPCLKPLQFPIQPGFPGQPKHYRIP